MLTYCIDVLDRFSKCPQLCDFSTTPWKERNLTDTSPFDGWTEENFAQIESKYWNVVKRARSKAEVCYACDIDSRKYRLGFEAPSGLPSSEQAWVAAKRKAVDSYPKDCGNHYTQSR